jgi:TolB protein
MKLIVGLLAGAIAAGAEAAEPTQLFRAVDVEGVATPDGRVAFVSTRNSPGALELHVASADGKSLLQLTRQGGGKDTPAWSPDGRQLAFVWARDGNSDIYVMDSQGGEARRLTDNPNNDLHPFWSPDGRQIVFTRYMAGARPDDEGRLEVYSMNADGSGEQRLIKATEASYASPSPNGRHLVYWRSFDGNADIAIADADGSNERRLTKDSGFDGWPSWSPDGTRVAFARRRGETEADIYVVEVETGAETLGMGGEGRKTSPKWTPDGKSLIFSRTLQGQTGLWKIEVP